MTKEEYLQLAQNSAAFKALNPDLQKKILGAADEERNGYAETFMAGEKALLEATTDFVSHNDAICHKAKNDMNAAKRDYLMTSENEERRRTTNKTDNLINF